MLELIEKNIILITDIGIECDIEYVICKDKRIKSSKVNVTEDKIYKVVIELKEYSILNSIKFFHEIIDFLQYSYFIAYEKSIGDDYVKITFITTTEEKFGFKCEITFT